MKPAPSHRPLRSLLTGVLISAVACAAAQNQPAAPMGRIHGRVINPAGQPQNGGAISLSTDGGSTLSYTYPVNESGEYYGQAAPGEYMVIYRASDTPEGKVVDFVTGVEVKDGVDVEQNIDMTRQEYMNRLSPEQQKQIAALRGAVNVTGAENGAVAAINADLAKVMQDFQDIEHAVETAASKLGANASSQDVDAMAADIANSRDTEIETLMKKDTAMRPAEPVLWMDLAHAQLDLKEFEDAEDNYKHALDLATKANNPQPELIAAADAGLGEVYARSLMVDEANAAFAAAAKADPANAAAYLKDQALVFYQEKNVSAQIDAADVAIQADPGQAILYYIKAQGLALNAPLDPNSNKLVLPPDCIAAYQKYLELAPDGPHASEVRAVLQGTQSAPTPAPDQSKEN